MITATGIGSGLDVEGLVNQLITAESQPTLNRLNTQESILQAELSAYGTLQGALSGLQSATTDVRQLNTYQKRAVSTTGEGVVATANTNAATGNFSIDVTQLAKSHSLASASFTSPTDSVGTGTITIRFGTTDYVSGTDTYNSFTLNEDTSTVAISVDSNNDTLEGVRDTINNLNAGISAAVVNDGSGYRLLLTSASTGANQSLEIVVDDDDLNDTDTSGLSRFAFNSSATNLEQTVAASDANFTINGLSVTNSDNTVTGVIDGINLDLQQVTTSSVDVSVTRDETAVRAAIEGFVNGYRAFNNVVNQLSQFDAETQTGSILLGDSTLRSVASQVRQVLTNGVDNFSGAFTSLSEIGITTDVNGNLNIDDAKLDDAIENHFDDLAAFFAVLGTIEDDTVSFVGSNSETQPGVYDVSITQLATQGSISGTGVLPDFGGGGTVTINDTNDSLTLSVNGTTGSLFNLSQGVYSSGESLAAEIQTRINGVSEFSNAGITVTVGYSDITDSLTITSTSYGSETSVNVLSIDGTTTATLGLSIANGTDGLDVAGSIDGVAATGLGQTLTGADGTDVEGLVLSVTGGVIGARGSMTFTRGITDLLSTSITNMLATDGLVDARTQGISSSIELVEQDREDHLARMEQVESRLRAEFGALDALVAQLQNTGSFLTNALASLPQPATSSS